MDEDEDEYKKELQESETNGKIWVIEGLELASRESPSLVQIMECAAAGGGESATGDWRLAVGGVSAADAEVQLELRRSWRWRLALEKRGGRRWLAGRQKSEAKKKWFYFLGLSIHSLNKLDLITSKFFILSRFFFSLGEIFNFFFLV